MCDTFVAMPETTKRGNMIFGKNSDRSPNEPHVYLHVPHCIHEDADTVPLKCTYISVPEARETFEAFLFKPSSMWGAEMGYNEYGLYMGNEAVFTTEPYDKKDDALTGMDMIRLCLTRCKTPIEAVDLIIELLGIFGQGGNCAYDHKFYYHNSFLIASNKCAYVLETAGKFWAYKKVDGVYAISNCLSIEKDFDKIHPEAIDYCIKKGKCENREDFSFKAAFTEPLFTKFSGAEARREMVKTFLVAHEGFITLEAAMATLRQHSESHKNHAFSSVTSPCMHFGGIVGDHTTGSFVAEAVSNPKNDAVFATLASTPCLAVYKPLLSFGAVPEEDSYYWRLREYLTRSFFCKGADTAAYLKERDDYEERFLKLVSYSDLSDAATRDKITQKAIKEEDEIIKKYLKTAPEKLKFDGTLIYKLQWSKKTKAFLK